MKIDFSTLPLNDDPFSRDVMGFLDQKYRNALAQVMELVLIDTGSAQARENWQNNQLNNLLKFAWQRSAFWRERIKTLHPAKKRLSSLPILTREDLREQVNKEGCLLNSSDPMQYYQDSSSGSSGNPVKFFRSVMTAEYQNRRKWANYFINGYDISQNETHISGLQISDVFGGFSVEKLDSWAGPFEGLIKTGRGKEIKYHYSKIFEVLEELRCDRIGNIIAPPWVLADLLQHVNVSFLKDNGCVSWTYFGGSAEYLPLDQFDENKIAIRSTYSCREAGAIGLQCPKNNDIYHVANSNVIVEVDQEDVSEVDGYRLGNVLITHLHSYATPIIRYKVGDLAYYGSKCICGYNGPFLGKVVGRSKELIKKKDGSFRHFLVRVADNPWLLAYKEYRFIQVELDKIRVEIAGRDQLSDDEKNRFVDLVKNIAGQGISIEIVCCDSIDWRQSTKRLLFHSNFS